MIYQWHTTSDGSEYFVGSANAHGVHECRLIGPGTWYGQATVRIDRNGIARSDIVAIAVHDPTDTAENHRPAAVALAQIAAEHLKKSAPTLVDPSAKG